MRTMLWSWFANAIGRRADTFTAFVVFEPLKLVLHKGVLCEARGKVKATSGPPCNYIWPARSFYIFVITGQAKCSTDKIKTTDPIM